MIERILNKTQRRTVLAVHSERQRLFAEMAECDAALSDLAETYRAAYSLPEGEYHFAGDGNEIRIVKVEKPTQAAEDDAGTEGEKLVDSVVKAGDEDAGKGESD